MADVNPEVPALPAWVRQRLEVTVDPPPDIRAPRHEASFYGLINSILGTIFPATQSFMIKPQGLLRRPYVDPSLSLDSYDGPVRPHQDGHALVGDELFADFIIVKGSGVVQHDIIVSIVEVKKKKTRMSAAIKQLSDYIKMASPKQRYRHMCGFLVAGNRTQRFTYNFTNPFRPYVSHVIEFDTLDLEQQLAGLAADTWMLENDTPNIQRSIAPV